MHAMRRTWSSHLGVPRQLSGQVLRKLKQLRPRSRRRCVAQDDVDINSAKWSLGEVVGIEPAQSLELRRAPQAGRVDDAGTPRASALVAAMRATTLWYSPANAATPRRANSSTADAARCGSAAVSRITSSSGRPTIPPASLTSRTASSSPASKWWPASTQPGRVRGTRAPICTDDPSVRSAPGGDGGGFHALASPV